MVLEDYIAAIELDTKHPIHTLTISLSTKISPVNHDGTISVPDYQLLRTLIDDIHALYRTLTKKSTGARGVRLPQEVRPTDTSPHWAQHDIYTYTFIDRQGQRHLDLMLAVDGNTLIVNNSYYSETKEIRLLHDHFKKSLPEKAKTSPVI